MAPRFASPGGVAHAERWERLAPFFHDLPRSKITDWAVGYLPAFERELALSLTSSSTNARRRLLDHGCGKGAVARFLRERLGVGRVKGVDVSREMIDAASAEGGADFTWLRDHHRLPFPSGYFDGAMSFFVLVTMSDPQQQATVLREIWRVLATDAPLVILVNNPDETGRRFASVQSGEAGRTYNPGEPIRLRLFEPRATEPFVDDWDVFWPIEHYVGLLREAGFRDVHATSRSLDPKSADRARALGLDIEALDAERTHAPLVAIAGWR